MTLPKPDSYYLSGREMEEAITQVAHLAHAQGIRIALMGTVALILRGRGRFTRDVDFLAERKVLGLEQVTSLSESQSVRGFINRVPVDIVVDEVTKSFYAEALWEAEPIIQLYKRSKNGPHPELEDAMRLMGIVRTPYIAAMKFTVKRWKHRNDLERMLYERPLEGDERRELEVILVKHFGAQSWAEFEEIERKIRLCKADDVRMAGERSG